jgi:hypothetical protein
MKSHGSGCGDESPHALGFGSGRQARFALMESESESLQQVDIPTLAVQFLDFHITPSSSDR